MQTPFPLRLVALALLGALAGGAFGLLGGCSANPPARAAVYDFGPGATRPQPQVRIAPLPSVLLAEVETTAALEGTAVLYRLAYADAQQLRPYAQARWAMPPSQLLRQHLREKLGPRRTVLSNTDAVAPGTLVLRVELEEFSQLFESATGSVGLVRVRATLGRSGNPPKALAQTSFVVSHAADTADAAGGVRALAQASDTLVQQLDQWMQQVAAAEPPGP